MATADAVPYSFTAVNSGVDWLTSTARGKAARRRFLAQGEALLKEDAGRGVEVTAARIRDYTGWKGDGVFVGTRKDDDLIILRSSRAAAQWQTIAPLATNVSRLDLQVTVWTHGEQPALSRWYYAKLKRQPATKGRPRELSLIQTHPAGDTLYVNKRTSDSYGRVYDFATAHKEGPPRTLWRFEVEFKRDAASHHAHSLLGSGVHPGRVESIVGAWYDRRGIRQVWTPQECFESQNVYSGKEERDVLLWFETSLSKTVAKAIRRHGVAAVLEALHLSGYVIERPRKETNAYASVADSTVHARRRG